MKDNARRVTVYLNEDNCDYLEERKEKKGISYSDTVNAALVNYRNSKVQKKAEELEQKLQELQKANTKQNMAAADDKKSDSEQFAEVMKSFM